MFKKGDKVRALKSWEANFSNWPSIVEDKIYTVERNQLKASSHVQLEETRYNFGDAACWDPTWFVLHTDPLENLKKAVAEARDAGYTITIKIQKTIEEDL